jgi:DNA-nicking Smr family endonuclease
MAPRRPKHLDSEDQELWRRVTDTVKPLRTEPLKPKRAADSIKALAPEPQPALSPATKKTRPIVRPAEPAVRKQVPPPAPSLAPLDKRLTRRIGKGSRVVDAKIDLHGLTQREAHARLLSFLHVARDRGYRVVLVVTGKGKVEDHGDWWEEGTRGVLRRSVPEWLSTPPFRSMVVGYERAHLKKGGDGALYVQLRRSDRFSGDSDR